MGRRAEGHVVTETGFGTCDVRGLVTGDPQIFARTKEGSEATGMGAPY